jgi:hypothetical protein
MPTFEIPIVKRQTTQELLQPISGKEGPGGRMYEPPKIDEGSEEAEAKKELERRIKVIFDEDPVLKACTFKFERFMRYATGGIFMVDVTVEDHKAFPEDFLRRALEHCYSVNMATKTSEYFQYQLAFDISKFENQLVSNREPAGIYVDEAPLTLGQITRQREHWANKQFDDVVQPNIDRYSTAFQRIEEVDGELRIHADTAGSHGDDLLAAYVLGHKPLGFRIDHSDGNPPGNRGVFLRVSFEDFKKLLPSTTADEVRAEVSDDVAKATE